MIYSKFLSGLLRLFVICVVSSRHCIIDLQCVFVVFSDHFKNAANVLSCQPRVTVVTVRSCFAYKVIRDL